MSIKFKQNLNNYHLPSLPACQTVVDQNRDVFFPKRSGSQVMSWLRTEINKRKNKDDEPRMYFILTAI